MRELHDRNRWARRVLGGVGLDSDSGHLAGCHGDHHRHLLVPLADGAGSAEAEGGPEGGTKALSLPGRVPALAPPPHKTSRPNS